MTESDIPYVGKTTIEKFVKEYRNLMLLQALISRTSNVQETENTIRATDRFPKLG